MAMITPAGESTSRLVVVASCLLDGCGDGFLKVKVVTFPSLHASLTCTDPSSRPVELILQSLKLCLIAQSPAIRSAAA